jgi:pimeloyl-ACP methyl ester carboxylesterase
VINSIAYRQTTPLYMKLLRAPWLGEIVAGLMRAVLKLRAGGRCLDRPRLPIASEALPDIPHCLLQPGGIGGFLCTARQMKQYPVGKLRCPTLQVPTLVLRGERDSVVPMWVHRRLTKELPDGRMVELKGCAHLPQETEPEKTAHAILGFLDEIGLSAGEAHVPEASA